jgi:hypothetical protein
VDPSRQGARAALRELIGPCELAQMIRECETLGRELRRSLGLPDRYGVPSQVIGPGNRKPGMLSPSPSSAARNRGLSAFRGLATNFAF